MADTKASTKRTSSAKTSGNDLSEEERAAMAETIRERKKAAKLTPEEQRAEGEADVQAKIAEMAEDDRAIAGAVPWMPSWSARRTSWRAFCAPLSLRLSESQNEHESVRLRT